MPSSILSLHDVSIVVAPQMVMMAANYLDDETIIRKLPFITPDEVDGILAKKEEKDQEVFEAVMAQQENEEEPEEAEEEV